MITIKPAYGRDYAKESEVLQGWNAGKDFLIIEHSNPCHCGAYLNKEDAPKGESFHVYYRQGRASMIIKN